MLSRWIASLELSPFQTIGFCYIRLMRYLVILAAVFALNSCNTSIGMYRDAKMGFLWTKDKVQGMRNGGGGGSDPYGAPVY